MILINKVYIGICNNIKDYLLIQKELKKSLNKTILKIKYKLCTYLNVIESIDFNGNTLYIIYSKKLNSKKIESKLLKIIKIIGAQKEKILFSKKLMKILEDTENETIKKVIEQNKQIKDAYNYHIEEILKCIITAKQKHIEETNIYVLINRYNSKYNQLITNLANNYKCLTIITNNINEFKMLEKEIFSKYQIPIIVANNKKKSLTRAQFIINIDFDEELINKYLIKRDAVIFNISKNKIKKICGFNGLIINNIVLKNYNKIGCLSSRFNDFIDKNSKSIEILELLGNNSRVSLREFKNDKY